LQFLAALFPPNLKGESPRGICSLFWQIHLLSKGDIRECTCGYTLLRADGTIRGWGRLQRVRGKRITFTTNNGRITRMEIKKIGSQPSGKGPADWFTGTVRIDPLFPAPAPARGVGASVTFEPGARTAWHTHPLGQTLIVTAGLGWVQREGGSVEEIRPGDVVWFSPNEKHWHGASPTTGMTHIAIQEKLDDKTVEWLEHVSEEQYHR
jgi:quercetin dioxygenase-like cupin family protein